MIGYLNPGDVLTAAHWNDVFAAADALLTSELGGLSALFANVGNRGIYLTQNYADIQFDRCFFFFNPVTLPSGLHPLAAAWLADFPNQWPAWQGPMFWRQYSDTALLSIVSGLSILATSTKFGVVKLAQPDWSAWFSGVYPLGLGSVNPITSGLRYTTDGGATYPTCLNCLDVSLGIITRGGNNVTFKDVTTAEHFQPLKPVDVFINADLTWDSGWNKYAVVRVHNCDRVSHAAFSTSIAAGASRCFRKLAGAWTAQGNYFHWMAAGDGRFLQMREATTGAASIFQPGVVLNVLESVLRGRGDRLSAGASNFGRYSNAAHFWDTANLYHDGTYYPALTGSPLLGDLLVHRGKVLAFKNNFSAPVIDFTGFANLASALSAAGFTTRALTQTDPFVSGGTLTNLEIYHAGDSDNYALADLSSPLVTFLTGGVGAARYAGVNQSSTPPSLKLPLLQFTAIDVQNSPQTDTLYYHNFIQSGPTGDPSSTDLVTVTVNRSVPTVTAKNKAFLPTDSLSSVEAWISSTLTAGGVVTVENMVRRSTPFGAALQWEELWPISALLVTDVTPWTASPVGTKPVPIASVVLDQGQASRLRVTRTLFLNNAAYAANTFGLWPLAVGGSPMLLWNFPRTPQQYGWNRFFYHDPADAPMMPDWHLTFLGSNYSWLRYQPGGTPTAASGDDLTLNQNNTVVAWFESAPIGFDSPMIGKTYYKPGIARLGAWTRGSDVWAPLGEWVNGAGSFTWGVAPDLGTSYHDIRLDGISLISAAVQNLTADPDQQTPNLLPCQVEHFNLVASVVNCQPLVKSLAAALSRTFIGIQRDGTVYGAVDASVGVFVPRNAYCSWLAPATGTDTTAAWWTGFSVAVKSGFPDTYPAGLTTDQQAVSNRLRWVLIDDVRTLANTLSLPFVLDSYGYPATWKETPVRFEEASDGGWLFIQTNQVLVAAKTALTDPDKTTLPGSFGVYPPADWPSPSSRGLAVSNLVIQREGLGDLLCAVVPLNYAYRLPDQAHYRWGPFYMPSGMGDPDPWKYFDEIYGPGVPYFADNTVETAQAEINVIPGAGGAGDYEHTVTTSLPSTRVVLIPIDGQIFPPMDGGL